MNSKLRIPLCWKAAEGHLALGDTTAAEERLARIEQSFNSTPFRFNRLLVMTQRPWIGRAWLRTGDLMVARGHQADAIKMYRRVVGLWGGAGVDREVKPVADSARGRLQTLGLRP